METIVDKATQALKESLDLEASRDLLETALMDPIFSTVIGIHSKNREAWLARTCFIMGFQYCLECFSKTEAATGGRNPTGLGGN